MHEIAIQISGMSCEHCVRALKKALGQVAGVVVQDVKVGSAVLRFDASTTSLEAIHKAIRDEGFEPRP